MPVNDRRLVGLVLKADVEALSGIKDPPGCRDTEHRSWLSVDLDRPAPGKELDAARTCGLCLGAARAELDLRAPLSAPRAAAVRN